MPVKIKCRDTASAILNSAGLGKGFQPGHGQAVAARAGQVPFVVLPNSSIGQGGQHRDRSARTVARARNSTPKPETAFLENVARNI